MRFITFGNPLPMSGGLFRFYGEESCVLSTSSRRSIALPELSEKPLQPLDMTFPRRPFGKTKVVHRSFQSMWYKQRKWLHYHASNDLTYCFICVKAIQSGMQMCFCSYLVKCFKLEILNVNDYVGVV